MAQQNKNESTQVLQVKLKVVTVIVILMLAWQVIDFLRVSSTQNSIKSIRQDIPSEYVVEQNSDNIKDMRRDITDIKNDMWDKADKSAVKKEIEDIYDCTNDIYNYINRYLYE